MTDLSPDSIRTAATTYSEQHPFARVETDRLETLPDAVDSGSLLWKDAEWIVRWYCRRPLDTRDRSAEGAFRANDLEEIRTRLDLARNTETPRDAVASLTALSGVDVPIASALLQFTDPTTFAVMDERSWNVLAAHEVLADPYPESPTPDSYRTYLDRCRSLGAEADLPPSDVARALWVFGTDWLEP